MTSSSVRAAVFQDYGAYALAARENIALGYVENIDDRAGGEAAARRAEAHELITRLPAGYETRLTRAFEGGVELSGGEWQKIALARGFFSRGHALILGEPTASLDPEAEERVFNKLLTEEQRTVILISHRLSTVCLADRIVVLDEGRVVEEGGHERLMAAGGRYARMFRFQASGGQTGSEDEDRAATVEPAGSA